MKILPQWVREFVDLKVDERALAADLTAAGIAIEGSSGEGAATVFEAEVTTNRVDAMNHYGVARECAAIYDTALKPIEPKLPAGKGDAKFPIEIEDAKGCARYTARVVRGVTIKTSPAKIAKRLEAVEARPINNVADASNYTLLEMGHPTHAFDLDTLEGGKIVVRRARDGETLKTLDGVDRKLTRDDLVIADARRPVALAGVMGGFDTMITERTKNVLIESAWFDPASIRKTARRHGMHTDASHRFERGADWGATQLACARVAQLILESAGGQLEGAESDAVARRIERAPIALRHAEIRRILGEDIEEAEVERILRRLGFGVTPGRRSTVAVASGMPAGSGGTGAAIAEQVADLTVDIPTWRLDVEREIDLVEEVARIHGYNKFANTLPSFSGGVIELPDAATDRRLRSMLLALGYHEALTTSFISQDEARQFATVGVAELANPISDEASVMRTSLVPGMLAMLAYNLNRGTNDVRLFEAGHVYHMAGANPTEPKVICLGATGTAEPASVHGAPRAYSFYDLKGDVEQLLGGFEHKALYFDAHAADYYDAARAARAVMDGATVARLGAIAPALAQGRKMRQDVWIAEIYLDRLYQHALREPRYQPIPRYPAVDRDFSFLMPGDVTFERISTVVEALKIAEMRSFRPVEVFRGGAVPAGKYSMLLRAEFQSAERTLRDDEVALWAQQIVKALEALGGTLRA